MTFIHGYLLGGLVLVGLPVLLHLIMRQKPKRLPFPAFRFLKQRHRINQRKLRLQHFLLLALRMLIIAAICLALTRPRVFSWRLSLGTERPVVAVFVFDTSASMEYSVGGVSRLDDAKAKARELIEQMADGSEIAILEAGSDSNENLLPQKAATLARLDGLRVRPSAGALNRTVERALRLLDQAEKGEDAKPRLLYVFSDRTRACWESSETGKVTVPDGVQAVFIDVGVESPKDLAIDRVEVEPAVALPGDAVQVRVTVRGTGEQTENELICLIENDRDADHPAERRPVQLARGQTSEVITFQRTAPAADPNLADTPYQVTVRLARPDLLPFNDVRYATFTVRGDRKLLTIVERDPAEARIWRAAVNAKRNFLCEVRTVEEVEKWDAKKLSSYRVACLFQVPAPPEALCLKLRDYVRQGGGLAVVPGGQEAIPEREAFNRRLSAAAGLLPATLERVVSLPKDGKAYWSRFPPDHPITAQFLKWSRTTDADFAREELRPFARRYWEVKPVDKDAVVLATYAAKGNPPVLVERPLGRGRVLQFTTPMGATRGTETPWHNYWTDSSFGLVLTDQVCRYLAGESAQPEVNYLCGQLPQVALPAPLSPPYTLDGPVLSPSEKTLKTPADEGPAGGKLTVPQAQVPGHFLVQDSTGRTVAGFSVNVRAEESDLDRVPVEELESSLGKGAVLRVDRAISVSEAIQQTRPPPVELLPYLMILLLAVLFGESVLANKFYRRPAPVPGEDDKVTS
jgi:hypothetical protein